VGEEKAEPVVAAVSDGSVENPTSPAPPFPAPRPAGFEASTQFIPVGGGQALFPSTGGSAGSVELAHGPLETVTGPIQIVPTT